MLITTGSIKCGRVERYLQEEILALLPVYNGRDRALVLTKAGRHEEPRTVHWLVQKIAAFYSIDLSVLRKRCRELLNLNHHISLPVSDHLVLLPVKVRQAETAGETTIGYISMFQVADILHPPAGEGSLWLSRILFKSGLELGCLNTVDTIQQRLRQGEIVRSDFIKRRHRGAAFMGLNRNTLAEQLPNCDCVLKDMFAGLFGLEEKEVP